MADTVSCLPPFIYVADSDATAETILLAVDEGFKKYKDALSDKSDLVAGFTSPSDIQEYNRLNPDNPIAIVRVEYQRHNIKRKVGQTSLFDYMAKEWIV